MKKTKSVLMGLAAISMAVAAAQAASYIDENFDAIALGEYDDADRDCKASAIHAKVWNKDADTAIVDAKFGDAGNHALDIIGDGGAASVTYLAEDSVEGRGSFSMKFNYNGHTCKIALLGGAKSAVDLSLGIGGKFSFYNGTANIAFDQTVRFSKDHTLIIQFDTKTDTFTGTLNGITLTANDGATETFDFRTKVRYLDTVRLVSGNARHFYVDDLKLIPESITVGLFPAVGPVLGWCR